MACCVFFEKVSVVLTFLGLSMFCSIKGSYTIYLRSYIKWLPPPDTESCQEILKILLLRMITRTEGAVYICIIHI